MLSVSYFSFTIVIANSKNSLDMNSRDFKVVSLTWIFRSWIVLCFSVFLLRVFLHQQGHLLQQNLCVSVLPVHPHQAAQLFVSWKVQSKGTVLWEVLLPSDHSPLLPVWFLCMFHDLFLFPSDGKAFWCGFLLVRDVELGRYLAVFITGCRTAAGEAWRHFSAKPESCFECNRSGMHTEKCQRTYCSTNNNSI